MEKKEVLKIGENIVDESVEIDWGKTRENGYEFIQDFIADDIVVVCKDCNYEDDIEHFLIQRKGKIIPLTCPICYKTKSKNKG